MENPSLFCFGLGYSAKRLSENLMAEGWTVSGTCRDADQAAVLNDEGIEAHLFDGQGEANAAWLDGATHVLNSVPPGKQGDPVLRAFSKIIAGRHDLTWIGYLSTTGVYGDTGGEWVDETAPVRADVPRSQHRAEAEQAWMALHRDHGLPVHLFRLAGIYGPGRSPLDTIRAGKARRIDKPGHRFSRIHVDDIAQVLRASIAKPNPGAVYNVCDDEPAEPATVTAFGCELLGIEPPELVPFEDAAKTMTPMGLSFWQDNRRVRNDRIKDELGVKLAFPTYREGLRGLLD
jgi:nucleoside-diphosphate-sugar epimerase